MSGQQPRGVGLNVSVVQAIQSDLQATIDYVAPLDLDELGESFFGGSELGAALLQDVRDGRSHVLTGLSNLHQGLSNFHDALGSAAKARDEADDDAKNYAHGLQSGTDAIHKPFWEKGEDNRPDPNDGNVVFHFDPERGGKFATPI